MREMPKIQPLGEMLLWNRHMKFNARQTQKEVIYHFWTEFFFFRNVASMKNIDILNLPCNFRWNTGISLTVEILLFSHFYFIPCDTSAYGLIIQRIAGSLVQILPQYLGQWVH